MDYVDSNPQGMGEVCTNINGLPTAKAVGNYRLSQFYNSVHTQNYRLSQFYNSVHTQSVKGYQRASSGENLNQHSFAQMSFDDV